MQDNVKRLARDLEYLGAKIRLTISAEESKPADQINITVIDLLTEALDEVRYTWQNVSIAVSYAGGD